MMDGMGFAIIGLGHRAEMHANAISNLDCGYLSALCSRSIKTAEEFASRHRCLNIYDEVEYLLDDYRVDVVIISSPNALHLEQAKMAIASGRSIIVECPVEIDSKRVRMLLDFADEEGAFVSSPIGIAFSDEFLNAKKRLEENNIGNIKKVELSMSLKPPVYAISTKWRQDSSLYGQSKIVSEGFASLYLLVSLFGMPKDITYAGSFKGTFDNGAELDIKINTEADDFIKIFSEDEIIEIPCREENSSDIFLDRFYSDFISSMEAGRTMHVDSKNMCIAMDLANILNNLL